MPLAGDESSERIDKIQNGEERVRRSEFGVKFVGLALVGFLAWACIAVGFQEVDKSLIGGIVLICIGAYFIRVIWKFLGE